MTPDNRLVFYEPVQLLQNMVAFRVALDLWIYYIECELNGVTNAILGRICVTDSYRTREVDVRKMVDILKLPTVVEEAIKLRVKSICAQVLALSAYCRNQVFFHDLEVERSLASFIWRPDGTIDYEKIIKRVIKGTELNERQRFALMCEYCMEDDIRRAWLQLKDRRFLADAQFESNPLTVYWSCVMDGDFSRIHVDDIVEARNYVLENATNLNLSAVEYFFGQMSTGQRITYGMHLMKKGGAKVAKTLISMYTSDEQRAFFSTYNYGAKLVRVFACPENSNNFAGYENHLEYAVKTWLFVRHLVNGYQFISMMRKIGEQRLYADRVHELLVELWRSSPQPLKKFVYDLPEDDQFLYWFCIRPQYANPRWAFRPREDGILIEVLSDATPEFRKKFWHRYWADIVDGSRASELKTIMRLCPSKDEINEYKSRIMYSDVVRRYFIELIAHGRYSDLNEFLHMLLCGEEFEINRIRRVLLEQSNATVIVKKCEPTDGSVNALNDFLAQTFGNDIRRMREFKIQMVLECLTPASLSVRYELIRIFCVSERLCDEQMLTKVKEEILQKCRRVASDPEMNYCMRQVEWPMLLRWCLGSEDDVDELNRTLMIR